MIDPRKEAVSAARLSLTPIRPIAQPKLFDSGGERNMSKRTFSALSVLVLLGLVLAACQPAAKPFTCTDKIGCVDIAPGAPIHIAYAMVVAGPDETLGIDSR